MLSTVSVSDDIWDAFVHAHPRGHVLQLSNYGALKSAFGWSSARITLAEDGELVAGTQILLRPFPFKLGRLAYLPMGPLVSTPEHSTYLWKMIDRHLRNTDRAVFIKWEPGIYHDEKNMPDVKQFGFKPTDQTIQPPNTILIDLHNKEDVIMSRMNQGTRRKIRKSFKNDVRYYEATRADIHKFTDMMQTTGERNEFGVHEPDYYQLAYDLFVPKGEASLILAEHEGNVLAGIMVFAVGKTAWYLYGASSNIKRNMMAAYGVQWQAIQWAKARGCRIYDMWGIPDIHEVILEENFTDRRDGLWGVYGFKRGWGGDVVRAMGAYDKVYNAFIYSGYQTALKLRGG